MGIAVAQARARPGLDSKKMHHTDVGGVRVKVHVKDVNLGRPTEQYLKDHVQLQAGRRGARVLLKVERVRQLLPAAVKIFVECALLCFFRR